MGHLCELFKVNSPLLMGGLYRMCINQKPLQKCSGGPRGDCVCTDQTIPLLSLLQIVDTCSCVHTSPQVSPGGWNELFSKISLLGLSFIEPQLTGNTHVKCYTHVMSHELSGFWAWAPSPSGGLIVLVLMGFTCG